MRGMVKEDGGKSRPPVAAPGGSDGLPLAALGSDRSSAGYRRRSIEELGRQVRRLHDTGHTSARWWSDRDAAVPAAGPLPATGGRRGGTRAREKNLARGYREAAGPIRRADILRFLRGYLGGIKDSAARAFIDRLKRRALTIPACRLRDRALVAESELVAARREGAWRFLADRTEESARLAVCLGGGADSVLAGGVALPGRGKNSRAARITVDGTPYFLKFFRGGRPRSRARRVWAICWRLRANGIPLPRPVLFGERAGEACLVTAFADGYRPLAELWPQAGDAQRRTLLVRAAILLGRLHRLGWIHGDFNWHNILVGPAGDLLLVDLDCAKPVRWFARDRFFRDVQHFLRDLLRPDNQGERWKGLFLAVWRRWSGVGASVTSPCNVDAA